MCVFTKAGKYTEHIMSKVLRMAWGWWGAASELYVTPTCASFSVTEG